MVFFTASWLAGCVNPAFFEGTPTVFRYVAGGPTVVAARAQPPFAGPGETVTIEALLMGPDPAEIAVDGCGWSLDRPSQGCFSAPSFYEPLGSTLPLTVTLPDWEPDGFEACTETDIWETGDTGDGPPRKCTRGADVRVRVLDQDGGASDAIVRIPVLFEPLAPRPPVDSPTFDVPEAVTPGATVTLHVRFPIPSDVQADLALFAEPQPVQWTIDGGQLLGTGATTGRIVKDELLAENRWVVPEQPGRYRITAVRTWPRFPSLRTPAWGTITVEVAR